GSPSECPPLRADLSRDGRSGLSFSAPPLLLRTVSESREQSVSDGPPEMEPRRPQDNGARVADVSQAEAPALDELIPVGDEQARVGTVVADRYRITQLIGTGGM